MSTPKPSAQGGLPESALRRLQRQATSKVGAVPLFTSDLSTNELVLLRQAGCVPLGQVLGGSVYQIGVEWRTANWRDSDRGKPFSFELQVTTRGIAEARRLAFGRMREEATLLGASGVVGVRLDWSVRELEDGLGFLLEVKALGTAVREPGARPSPSSLPFLSNLSGQVVLVLRRAGYRAVGLAAGNCSYGHVGSWQAYWAMASGPLGTGVRNQEIGEFTQALYEARELAMGRMEEEARGWNAEGIVAARIHMESRVQDGAGGTSGLTGMAFHITALGTAIQHASSDSAPEVDLCVPLI